MNTLIVSSYNIGSCSSAIMLEQLEKAIHQKGPTDRVFYLTCSNTFSCCYFNYAADPERCFLCRSNAESNTKLIDSDDFTHLSFADIILEQDWEEAKRFYAEHQRIDMDLTFDGFDLGEALMSTYISRTRNRDPEVANASPYIEQAKFNTLALYLGMRRFLGDQKVGQVLNFNGRYDYARAIFRGAQMLDIPCLNYERTRPGGYIEMFENTLPHDIKAKNEWIAKAWDTSSLTNEQKIEVGTNFYRKKRSGEAVIDKSYTSDQKTGHVPEEFTRPGVRYIVLFTSSDDEFVAAGKDFVNPYFPDQLAGINYVADCISGMPDTELIIRMHPNLKGIKEDYALDIHLVHRKYPNVTVIPPESVVDSYALLDIATTVVTFGSSIGMEANFWGKPVLLLGRSFYLYLDVAYIPTKKEEISTLLKQNLSPKDTLGAIKYGYYALEGGEKAESYSQTAVFSEVMFKGQPLNTYSLPTRLLGKVIKWVYQTTGTKLKLAWVK